MNSLARGATIAALVVLGGSAQAQKAGDWVIGAGVLGYLPQDASEPLRFTQPVASVIPGSGASVRNAATLGLDAHYFVTDNWAVEAVFGVPPRVKLDGAGTLAGVGQLGDARLWAPAVLGKYFFGHAEDKLRFSLGAGLSYNAFRSVHLTGNLQNALAGALGLPPGVSSTTASIGNRWAPVFNAGINYAIDRHWGVGFSLSYLPMKVRANLDTTVAGKTVARSTTRIRLDPVVPYLSVTYRF